MSRRIRHLLLEAAALLLTISTTELAVGATATAVITVTILAPVSHAESLMLSSTELDMRGKMSDEITITNRSGAMKELRITLSAPSASLPGCQLHYSPMSASLPPGEVQVVRLLLATGRSEVCTMEHHLMIADARDPMQPVYDVPIYTGWF